MIEKGETSTNARFSLVRHYHITTLSSTANFLMNLFSFHTLHLGSSNRERGQKRGMQFEGICSQSSTGLGKKSTNLKIKTKCVGSQNDFECSMSAI